MAKYSIEETTLIDIGDALRRKHGETKMGTILEEQYIPADVVISKTNNATGFHTWEGSYRNYEEWDEVDTTYHYIFNVVHIPTAKSVSVKLRYALNNSQPPDEFMVGKGSCKSLIEWIREGNLSLSTWHGSCGNDEYIERTFDNTEYITFMLKICKENVDIPMDSLGYYAEVWGLDENGMPLEEKIIYIEKEAEVPNTYSSAEMAAAIDAIEVGEKLPEEALVICDNCTYKFSNNGWNWFVEQYGDRIITKDITNGKYMFDGSTKLADVPFDLNFKIISSGVGISYLFRNCETLKQVPKCINIKPSDLENFFDGCKNIREIPDDFVDGFDWSYIESLTSQYSGSRCYTFRTCYSLRSFPMEFLNHGNPNVYNSYSIYTSAFANCYTLDEIKELPFPHLKASWTSNAFPNSFDHCSRAKDITFALQEDGTPYAVKWKSQTIDLTNNVGYVANKNNILNYNSGITADKEVTDADTYAALKDDPDWFTTKVEYSRYNYNSAVNTINSLPDASATGTNTIKFKGASGSLTDGGAINALTEEELAVGIQKGWTITFV